MNKETLERIKREVTFTPGASQDQRERWYIIMQLHEIKQQLRTLDRRADK